MCFTDHPFSIIVFSSTGAFTERKFSLTRLRLTELPGKCTIEKRVKLLLYYLTTEFTLLCIKVRKAVRNSRL